MYSYIDKVERESGVHKFLCSHENAKILRIICFPEEKKVIHIFLWLSLLGQMNSDFDEVIIRSKENLNTLYKTGL